MKTYLITNYNSIGFTIGIGRELLMGRHIYKHDRTIHITIGFLFWTYIIYIKI